MAQKERTPRPPTPLGPAGEALRENLKRIREEKRLTFVELSKHLDEIGRPIPVLGLRRIEMGQRRVDVDDLMALSQVLNTPPVLLLVPLGRTPVTEVVPGRVEDAWDAVRWMAGRDRSLTTDWRQSEVPTQLWEEHDKSLSDWLYADEFYAESIRRGVPAEVAQRNLEAGKAGSERSLRIIRTQMRALALTPPVLPVELMDLDKAEEAEVTE